MRRPTLAAALVAALLAPTALAQEGRPFELRLDHETLLVLPGGTATTNLTVENPNLRAYKVVVQAAPDAGAPLRAGVKPAEFGLAAGAAGHATVQVTVAPDATPGEYLVSVSARVPDGNVSSPFASVLLRVDVRTRPAAATTAILAFEPFAGLLANPGGTADGNVTIRAHRAGTYRFETKAPPGVHVALGREAVTLDADATATLPLHVAVEDNLTGGEYPIMIVAVLEGAPLVAPARLPVPLRVLVPTQDLAQRAVAAADEDAPSDAWAVGGAIAVAGAGAGAAGLWWASRRGWAVPLLAPLYTRIAKNRVLDQPTRERIAKLVQDEPGITFGEVSRRVDVAAGQLTHHARMLEDAGVIFSTRDGQQRRFFHVGHGRVDAVPPLAERALARLQEEGPMRVSDLARALGASRQALHYHAKKLADEGRVSLDAEGRLVPVVMPKR